MTSREERKMAFLKEFLLLLEKHGAVYHMRDRHLNYDPGIYISSPDDKELCLFRLNERTMCRADDRTHEQRIRDLNPGRDSHA